MGSDLTNIARRERINELYRRFWNPLGSHPRDGWPLTPDDHIHHMRGWLDLAERPEELPAVQVMASRDPEAAAEYARLLVEAASAP